MTTYAHADLHAILAAHRKWLSGQDGGTRADLTRAILTGADLRGAILTGADLTRAVLTGADLTDATLSDGVRWGEYLREVVPALLTAGGKSLAEVATPEVWACHSWGSDHEPLGCPIATAFDVHQLSDVPALHRWQAGRFVELYDAGLIPRPVVEEPAALTTNLES